MFHNGLTISEAWQMTDNDILICADIIKEFNKNSQSKNDSPGDSLPLPPGYKG